MMSPSPSNTRSSYKILQTRNKANERWRGSQVRVKRQKLPRDECRHHSNCFTCTVVDLQALDVLQTGVQAAPSVSGNLKTENAETIYIQRTMHLDPVKKKNKKKPLVSTPTVFFLSIPAPYLRPRHTCARAFYHKPSGRYRPVAGKLRVFTSDLAESEKVSAAKREIEGWAPLFMNMLCPRHGGPLTDRRPYDQGTSSCYDRVGFGTLKP